MAKVPTQKRDGTMLTVSVNVKHQWNDKYARELYVES